MNRKITIAINAMYRITLMVRKVNMLLKKVFTLFISSWFNSSFLKVEESTYEKAVIFN